MTISTLTQARNSFTPFSSLLLPHANTSSETSSGSSLPPHAIIHALNVSCLYYFRRLLYSGPALLSFTLPTEWPLQSKIRFAFKPSISTCCLQDEQGVLFPTYCGQLSPFISLPPPTSPPHIYPMLWTLRQKNHLPNTLMIPFFSLFLCFSIFPGTLFPFSPFSCLASF